MSLKKLVQIASNISTPQILKTKQTKIFLKMLKSICARKISVQGMDKLLEDIHQISNSYTEIDKLAAEGKMQLPYLNSDGWKRRKRLSTKG